MGPREPEDMWGPVNPEPSVWGRGELGEERTREMAKVPGRSEGGPGSLTRLAHFFIGPPVTHPFLHLYYYYAHFTEGN